MATQGGGRTSTLGPIDNVRTFDSKVPLDDPEMSASQRKFVEMYYRSGRRDEEEVGMGRRGKERRDGLEEYTREMFSLAIHNK